MYRNGNWSKYQFCWGCDLTHWALPLEFAIGYADFARRWGVGIRFLCFTLAAEKDFKGYAISRSLI